MANREVLGGPDRKYNAGERAMYERAYEACAKLDVESLKKLTFRPDEAILEDAARDVIYNAGRERGARPR